ncbi:hypothetical protein [Kitasatospora sp. NBC_01300]|uniref:hypothetical protein n=1 Tax=Kitasatospora sp. NBC_01300 TaxID=2903574 RepID=UPI002F910B0F|nr:hypothetical protein OG556_40605 [Kitasatospora sp. NBC_01300]
MTTPNIVDLDDTTTWPPDLADLIGELAVSAPEGLDSAGDLHNVLGEHASFDEQVRTMLAGRLLRTYHVTRLLDYEVEDVRTLGLLALTETSLKSRVALAVEKGFLLESDLPALEQSTAFQHERPSVARSRLGEVSLASSRQPLAQPWPLKLLSKWGGEVRQFGPVSTNAEFDRIRRLGRPTLVVAGIDASTPPAKAAGRELLFDFIGVHLRLSGNGVTIHYGADIPNRQILEICHPGHAEYDRHTHFPRS